MPRKRKNKARVPLEKRLQYGPAVYVEDEYQYRFHCHVLENVLPVRETPSKRWMALAAFRLHALYEIRKMGWRPTHRTFTTHFHCPPPGTVSDAYHRCPRCQDRLCPFCWSTMAWKRYRYLRHAVKRCKMIEGRSALLLTFHHEYVRRLDEIGPLLGKMRKAVRMKAKGFSGVHFAVVSPLPASKDSQFRPAIWRVELRTLWFLPIAEREPRLLRPRGVIRRPYTQLRFNRLCAELFAFDERLLFTEHYQDHLALAKLRTSITQVDQPLLYSRFGKLRKKRSDINKPHAKAETKVVAPTKNKTGRHPRR